MNDDPKAMYGFQVGEIVETKIGLCEKDRKRIVAEADAAKKRSEEEKLAREKILSILTNIEGESLRWMRIAPEHAVSPRVAKILAKCRADLRRLANGRD